MRHVHLWSSGTALALLIAALTGFTVHARSLESQYVHVLAPRLLPVNISGTVLQRAAFQTADLLPVYGSSEMTNWTGPTCAVTTFRTYPTGFAPYQVAKAGVTSLVMAQAIAAIGPDVQGHKVVISFTPSTFFDKMIKKEQYAGLYSRLHANALIFSLTLSFATRQIAARRMLVYTDTLKDDPVLLFALQRLASDSLVDHALYYVAWPLGQVNLIIMELQDHWETLRLIGSQNNLNPDVVRKPAVIDWASLKAQAEREQSLNTNNNQYGFDNAVWGKYFEGRFKPRPPASADPIYEKNMSTSQEWTDFEVLLRVLKELGARPLLLGRPVNGTYWEAMGVSRAARAAYYQRLYAMANEYQVPIVDFKDHEMDKYFSTDTVSHTSRKGWVFVDETLDAYYHDRL